MPLLEVISTCPSDSLTIESCGADRIELVSALEIGGLTPSNTIIRKSLECVDIPTMVMVRHHNNNGFMYSEEEKELMCEEIKNLLEIGVKGIVVGGLIEIENNEGKKCVDLEFVKKVKEEIGTNNKVEVTFHKAIDYSNDIVKSYDDLNEIGVTRILTQGGELPILSNVKVIKQLVQKSMNEKSTEILLGGGITHDNIQKIIKETNAKEIHIGTCVRKDKYGSISKEKLAEFINLINNKKG